MELSVSILMVRHGYFIVSLAGQDITTRKSKNLLRKSIFTAELQRQAFDSRSLANEDTFSCTNRLISELNESLWIIDIKSQVRSQNASPSRYARLITVRSEFESTARGNICGFRS